MIRRVVLSKGAHKDLARVPVHVVRKLLNWVQDVEIHGLEEVRKISGYHDEPLKGERLGQRSIRLSKSYRAFYRLMDDQVVCVLVEEVNKHDY